MNILAPHDWLTEYLDIDVAPSTVQKELSLRGPSVERIIEQDGEIIYDIEVTTNRVDSMCIRGLAREIAVILQQSTNLSIKFLPTGPTPSLDLKQFEVPKNPLPLPKITINTDKVNRVMCVVLDQVEHTPTPDWMARRLTQVGENIHDSIIDITNYVTYELGHPCHAFDYDKVMALGGEIIIDIAAAKQSFKTLDGNSYETFGGEVIFTNPKGEIIDLPAIKGALNTAVDDQTKRVLFWFENLDAMTVRRASMQHGIRTLAASLNEKGVDPYVISDTMSLGLQFYQAICQAKIASEIYNYFPQENTPPPQVELRWERLINYLGTTDVHQFKVEYDQKTTETSHQGRSVVHPAIKYVVSNFLVKLGMTVETTKVGLLVTPPTFRRNDIQTEVDLIEEVARIYGYHNLPSTLNFTTVNIPAQAEFDFKFEQSIKNNLSSRGYFEVYTSSLISEAQAASYAVDLDKHLKVANPLTADKVYLRQSLIPSLQEVFAINKITPEQTFSIFELANIYYSVPKNKSLVPHENMTLAMLSNKPYREVITDLYQLLARFFIDCNELSLKSDGFDRIAKITVTDLHDQPPTRQENDLRRVHLYFGKNLKLGTISINQENRTAIECSLPILQNLSKRYPTYQAINRHPVLIEDLTFTIPTDTPVGDIIKLIKDLNPLIVNVKLSDIYERNFTFTVTYQGDRILENQDVAPIRQKIVDLLAKKKVSLVGKLPSLKK